MFHSYPAELQEFLEWRGGQLLVRPMRPGDTPRYRRFLARIEPEDLRLRFFTGVRELPDAEIEHLTHVDYDREMAFIAVAAAGDGDEEILGVARACCDPDGIRAEFALLVRSDLKRQGLGTLLLQKLVRYCRARGTQRLWGEVMCDNTPMLHLARSLGFDVRYLEGNLDEVALDLQPHG